MPFLRVPPFPGARSGPVQEASSVVAPRSPKPQEIARALVEQRVGGAFWGVRPALPDVSGRLVMQGWGEPLLPDIQVDGEGRISSQGAISSQGTVCDPWYLVDWAAEVCAPQTSDIGLIALLQGKLLTVPAAALPDQPEMALEAAVGAVLIAGQAYRDPFTTEPCDVLAVIRRLGFWRTLIEKNRSLDAVWGVAFWKQQSLAPLLWGGGEMPFAKDYRPLAGQTVAVWRARTADRVLAAIDAAGCTTFEIEDGFIRSTGLGADCVPPLSIVVDGKGAHFDPSGPSDLEDILANHAFTAAQCNRAAALRRILVGSGISKYAVASGKFSRAGGTRRHILVIGQVEDDRSWLKGGGDITSNLELLRRVRAHNPDAHLIFRPHPDVMAGHRKGHVSDAAALKLADQIAASAPITALIDAVDEVHVLTSLTGFEALLRKKPVTTWGVPFYAGWGLTTDLGPVPARRARRLSLDELAAAVLLLYPRYLDPVTMLPCPPEVTVQRLIAGQAPRGGLLVALRRLAGRASLAGRKLKGAA